MLYKKLARIGLPIVGQYIALTLQNIWHVDTKVNKIRKIYHGIPVALACRLLWNQPTTKFLHV
jgi:hypothetical protein